MPTGLDLEYELRIILEQVYGWMMMASPTLDHEKKIDFIIVGYRTRYLSKPLEVQMTLQKKNAGKIGDFINRSRERNNGNVKVYILVADDLPIASVARAVHSALSRKMMSRAVPNGIYLLQVDDRGIGYWRDPFAYTIAVETKQKAALTNSFRKPGKVTEVKPEGMVVRVKKEQRLYFAFFKDIVTPLPPRRSRNCRAQVGDQVTFLSSGKSEFGRLPLAEFVRFKKIVVDGQLLLPFKQ